MGIFSSFKKSAVITRKQDEYLYSLVAEELAENIRYDGLWIKALALANGNKDKQLAEYIKLRVQALKDELYIASEANLVNASKSDLESVTSKALDIDYFVEWLAKQPSLDSVRNYFSNVSSSQIKAFINQPDSADEYPLHVAVKCKSYVLTKWLLDSGAYPYVKNYWKLTPVEIAVRNEDEMLVQLLESTDN